MLEDANDGFATGKGVMTRSATMTTALTAARRAEFAQRWRECVNSYPFTPQGERQALTYAIEGAAARARYDAVRAMAARGEDATEAVLQGFLPYADTAANRANGRWITHAPAINRDLREWFASAGWAKDEDWPRISAAIWHFVRRAVERPAELRQACEVFSNSVGARGFQMGMLTPILHALRPDAFVAMPLATRIVLNRLTGMNYGPRLTVYPEVNALAWQTLADVEDLLRQPPAPTLTPADNFDLFCQWVMATKPHSFDHPYTWRIAIPDEATWQRWQREGYVALTAPLAPDVALQSPEEFAAWRASLARSTPATQHLWTFAHAVREGDAVFAHLGTQTLRGIGTVTGPYYAVPETADGHRLPVRWDETTAMPLKKPSWKTPFGKFNDRTLDLPTPRPIISAAHPTMHHLAETPAPYQPAPSNGHVPAYTLVACAAETGMDVARLESWVRTLERKGQAIIVGPPGTGKTYLAERLARVLSTPQGFSEMVQFHPAYTYEDFVQGLRPQTNALGALTYGMVPGRFMAFCERARHFAGTCVLVIDEINRAHLAQVFGEVLALLEYRDRAMPLAGGGTLQIPRNVRILGTMNTADRSIALVDRALRRRFAFLPLPPDYEVLRRYHTATDFPVAGLIATLRRVNAAIGDPHDALGISYFLRADLAETIMEIWQMEIEPYLEDYFFDQPAAVEAWRWHAVRKAILGKGPHGSA
jgi:hypothetical protein